MPEGSDRNAGQIIVPPSHNALVTRLLDACFVVHRTMGPGLLEGVYEACLAWELRDAGLIVERQKAVDLTYQDLLIPAAFRVDLVIGDHDGNRIIAELKSHANLPLVFHAQLISYLRFMNLPIGVLVNFHPPLLKDGISRVLNSGWKPV